MDAIGTATVKVVPDLSEFSRMMEAAIAADGLTIREDIAYEHDDEGHVVRQTKTTTIVRG